MIQDDGGRLREATEAQDEPVELKEHVSQLSFTKGLETILNWLGKSIKERPAVKFSRKEALHAKEGKVVCVKYWRPKYKSLKRAVKSIKDCKVEHAIVFDQHGNCVVEIVGTPTSVNMDIECDMTGWTVVHNHPNGSAFSDDDVKIRLSVQTCQANGRVWRRDIFLRSFSVFSAKVHTDPRCNNCGINGYTGNSRVEQ